jgi:putative long chain acyl-CoA synthase
VFTTPVRDALGELPEVDLAVAYGVRPSNGDHELAIAAVTLRAGRDLTAREISEALAGLEPERRPLIVRVVDRIPVTTWYRPLTGPLREEGIPEPGEGTQAWYLDASGERYRPLTDAARKRLLAAA